MTKYPWTWWRLTLYSWGFDFRAFKGTITYYNGVGEGILRLYWSPDGTPSHADARGWIVQRKERPDG